VEEPGLWKESGGARGVRSEKAASEEGKTEEKEERESATRRSASVACRTGRGEMGTLGGCGTRMIEEEVAARDLDGLVLDVGDGKTACGWARAKVCVQDERGGGAVEGERREKEEVRRGEEGEGQGRRGGNATKAITRPKLVVKH
jgi:hypothetical protein